MKNKIALSLVALAVAGSTMMATPATASPPVTERTTDAFVDAYLSDGDVTAVAFYRQMDDHLILQMTSVNRDLAGNIVGYTDYYADSNLLPYGTFQIDKSLTTATINVSGVSAQKCEFDAEWNYIGDCEYPVLIDAQVTFTGVGTTYKKPTTYQSQDENGCVTKFHTTGPSRNASVTGTIAGITLPSNAELFSLMTISATRNTVRCPPGVEVPGAFVSRT